MKRIDWKADYGNAVHIGIDGAIPEINEIAGWLNERCRQQLILIDSGIKQSTKLKSLAGPVFRTPPTVRGDVRLYVLPKELLDEQGKTTFPVHFLSITTDVRDGLTEMATGIRPGSIILGSADACADVLEAASLSAQPLFYCGGMLAVRAA